MKQTVVAMALAGLMAGLGPVHANHNEEQGDRDRVPSWENAKVVIGYSIAPVPLSKSRKNWALIGLGSYIVNAQGGCNDCHTRPSYAPGGNPHNGEPEKINAAQYLSGGRQFGPFTSSNLTPDASGRPGGLTFEQFRMAMRTGRDPDNPSKILQVMPWPVYSKMTERDLRSIYEYLSAIPSLPDNPAPGP